MGTVLLFQPGQHTPLIPYLAAIHASCITHDRTIATFLPPLSHEKLLAWWKDRIAEVVAGSRLLFILVRDDDSNDNNNNSSSSSSNSNDPTQQDRTLLLPRGPDVMGVVMLDMPQWETGSYRANIEKLLVHPSYRGRGGARALLTAVEKEALKRGRRTLTLDTETGSPAETVYKNLGYIEVGKIPKYEISPSGDLKDETFFYKSLDG